MWRDLLTKYSDVESWTSFDNLRCGVACSRGHFNEFYHRLGFTSNTLLMITKLRTLLVNVHGQFYSLLIHDGTVYFV